MGANTAFRLGRYLLWYTLDGRKRWCSYRKQPRFRRPSSPMRQQPSGERRDPSAVSYAFTWRKGSSGKAAM